MRLISVYDYPRPERYELLWQLLAERTPAQSISHREMPDWVQHLNFIDGHPYKAWYFICSPDDKTNVYGSIYLTHNNEIGVKVWDQWAGMGIGTQAVEGIMKLFSGPFYANINPANTDSIAFFEKLGFHQIQTTYKRDR